MRRSAIVGVWSVPDGSCEGDTSEIFRTDGSYRGDTYEGRWTVRGRRLTTKVERQGEMGGPLRTAPEPATVSTLLRLTRKLRVERWGDGSVHRLHHCG